MGPWMMGYGFNGMGMALWMGLGTLLSFIFLVAVIYIGARTVKTIFPGLGSAQPSSPSPLDILKTRYAKGEITREEFQRMKEEIS